MTSEMWFSSRLLVININVSWSNKLIQPPTLGILHPYQYVIFEVKNVVP